MRGLSRAVVATRAALSASILGAGFWLLGLFAAPAQGAPVGVQPAHELAATGGTLPLPILVTAAVLLLAGLALLAVVLIRRRRGDDAED